MDLRDIAQRLVDKNFWHALERELFLGEPIDTALFDAPKAQTRDVLLDIPLLRTYLQPRIELDIQPHSIPLEDLRVVAPEV